MLLPYPLQRRLVEPTLLEWALLEPSCSEPHRWLGGHDHLTRAVELDPKDELARRKLVLFILGKVGCSTHELPVGYLGVAEKDLEMLDEAENLLNGLSNEEDRL